MVKKDMRHRTNRTIDDVDVSLKSFVTAGSNATRGKSWEEIYGKEKAEQMKENLRKQRIGKTYVELYGAKNADQIKNKQSNAERILSEDEQHGVSIKLKSARAKRIISPEQRDNMKTAAIARWSREGRMPYKTRQKIRIKAIDRIIQLEGSCKPNYNPKACRYFDKLMVETNTFIQHAENGGEYHIKELGYFVDGYDKENNIVYEWDEKHHYYESGELKQYDIERQLNIEKMLGCGFIRIKQEDIYG